MENPHKLPAPDDPIARVHAFARDLAYGVAQGWWTTRMHISELGNESAWWCDGRISDDIKHFEELFTTKWANTPSEHILWSLGYLNLIRDDQSGNTRYILTEKAMQLLDAPIAPPNVFISYKRDQSSAFALLVEARLRLAGNPNPFVDKNIVAGEGWHGRLKETIQQSKFFVCLIGKATLQSEWVRQEIEWAAEAGCTIISVWHGGEIGDDTPVALRERHAITVTGESAREYETAISELLNAMGYATY